MCINRNIDILKTTFSANNRHWHSIQCPLKPPHWIPNGSFQISHLQNILSPINTRE